MQTVTSAFDEPLLKGKPDQISVKFSTPDLNNPYYLELYKNFTFTLFGMKWYANTINKRGVIHGITLALNKDTIKDYLNEQISNKEWVQRLSNKNYRGQYNFAQFLDKSISKISLVHSKSPRGFDAGLAYTFTTSKSLTGEQIEHALEILKRELRFKERVAVYELPNQSTSKVNCYQVRYLFSNR